MTQGTERLRVLLVEDDEDDFVLTRDLLGEARGVRFELSWSATVDDGLRAVRDSAPDVVLLDYRVGSETGLDFLGRLPVGGEVPPVILLTGQDDRETDVAAMRAGAADYLVKGEITPLLLERSIRYTVERARADADLRLRDRAIAAVSEGILITDPQRPDNPVVFANSGFERLTGYAAHEVVGRNCRFLQGPGTDPATVAEVAAAVRAGRGCVVELLNYRKDGTPFWNSLSITPVHDGAGKLTRFVGIQQDVTARREAADELLRAREEAEGTAARMRAVKEQHEALLNNIPDLAWLKDTDGHYLAVNEAYLGMVRHNRDVLPGAEREPVVGRTLVDLFEPEAARAFLAEDLRVLHAGERVVAEVPVQVAGGAVTWLESVKAPIRGADGRVTGMVGIARDITERKRAEEERGALLAELQAERSRLRSVVWHAPAFIATLRGPEHVFEMTNPAYDQLVGRRDLVGKPAREAFPELAGQGFFDLLDEVLRTGEPFVGSEMPMVLRRRPGGPPEERFLDFVYHPITGADGSVSGIFVHGVDVTARRQAEEELRRSERRFRSLVENAPDTVVILDARGDIRYFSPAVARILAYPAELLAGGNAFDLVHRDDLPRVWEVFQGLLDEPGCVARTEYRVRHGGGGWLWFETTAQNLLGDPAVEGVVINSRDVTERKRAEEALRLSEEQLRQAQRLDAVGKLAGGVAHDFNNVLTVIQGNAEMLLLDVPEDSPLREDVLEIRDACRRASKLTRQLLAFSRRQVLQPRVLDLNATVSEMEKMLRRLIGEDVHLVLALDPDLGRVEADPGQIEQVLLNLAVNARDAMPTGGTLEIETRNVRVAEEDAARRLASPPTGTYVVLTVRDTGTGMGEETAARVFEPFFTTKPQGKGTGLGLATVYGIIQQSGGCVRVRSRPGEGSAFDVYLPVVDREPEPRDILPRPSGSRVATGTILLVEDEDSVRSLARRVLERNGYRVLEARHPEMALELLSGSAGVVQLLLTDVVMPQMSGRALASRALAMSPGLRVMYMSGYTDDALAHHGVLEEGIHLIEKPFQPEALLSKVQEVLN